MLFEPNLSTKFPRYPASAVQAIPVISRGRLSLRAGSWAESARLPVPVKAKRNLYSYVKLVPAGTVHTTKKMLFREGPKNRNAGLGCCVITMYL